MQAQELLYGQTTSGMFGYSHLTGAYQGGQADYVRVPIGKCAAWLAAVLQRTLQRNSMLATKLADMHASGALCQCRQLTAWSCLATEQPTVA